MQIELVASWSCVPDREFQSQWLKVAPGSVGEFLADGSLSVRRAVAGAPVVASLTLPADALVELDPRGELVAYLSGAQLSVVTLPGVAVATTEVPPDMVVQSFCFRRDGQRLWVFGFVGSTFRALAYDRALARVGDYTPPLTLSPRGWPIQVHPSADAFVLTLSVDEEDPEAGVRRVGVQIEQGEATLVFDHGDIDYPCLAFTNDGRSLIGIDPFTRVMVLAWPTYVCTQDAALEPDHWGRPVGMIVGNHLVTERHSAPVTVYDPQTETAQSQDQHDSSLWVLALPTLEEEALIRWTDRGFGKAEDDAGLDLASALGDDTFLECRREDGDGGTYALRVWRLRAEA